jgi:hypothetical protein
MVRQFKIHTNLDGQDNKVWDVTNGNLRLYNPSNLGLEIANNIFNSNGIGVAGSRVLAQPDIEFDLETFCPTLDENYKIINEFVNDILAQKFVTLEYQTGLFQVYADLALSSVTKTEGFGRNGTFSEKISFNVITKWYTYENLSFEMIENGEVIAGKSKIYGGHKTSETALQNYNRLKNSPSLNLPNLNLLTNSRLQSGNVAPFTPVSGAILTVNSNVKGLNVSCSGGAIGYQQGVGQGTIPVSAGNQYTMSVKVINTGTVAIDNFKLQFGFYNSSGTGINYPNKIFSIPADGKVYSLSYTVTTTANTASIRYYCLDTATVADTAHTFTIYDMKVEQGSAVTPMMPSGSELTTDDISEYFGYNYIENTSYTYYGERDITRLSRWDIQNEIFSVVARLDPSSSGEVGVKFLNEIGNEYTALLFDTETKQDYILINTDVNDEFYNGWTGTTKINLFPTLDFQRYRTRIIEKGQMTLQNLKSAEFKIKRKADFM